MLWDAAAAVPKAVSSGQAFSHLCSGIKVTTIGVQGSGGLGCAMEPLPLVLPGGDHSYQVLWPGHPWALLQLWIHGDPKRGSPNLDFFHTRTCRRQAGLGGPGRC